MTENIDKKLWTIKKGYKISLLLIIAGIGIRIFMIIFYYFVNLNPNIPWGGWGDVNLNYHDVDTILSGDWVWSSGDLVYPPLSVYFILFLRVVSFNSVEVFAFYAFLLEFIVAISFYFVLKKFKISKRNVIFGIFLLNPFYFLNYVFSATNCGYHISDSFFCLFLIVALYFYPNDNKSLFYLFLGLSMCVKWFTLPAVPLIFLKFLFEKNWNEIKKIIIYFGIPIFIFLISPIFYLPNYIKLYAAWINMSQSAHAIPITLPIYIRIIPFTVLFVGYTLLRIKKASLLEITFVSIILMFTVMMWARLYLRFLTPLVFYGHLKTKEDIFTINIDFMNIHFRVGNHLLTYGLSILGCIGAIGIIIFIF
jgi:hypothetical protein